MKISLNKILSFILLCLISSCATDSAEPTIEPIPANFDIQGTVTVNSSSISICARDWGTVDGDVVTILFNGKALVSNLEMTGTNQCWELKNLPAGDNWIGIVALDEGYNPPASPRIEINDGVTTQAFEIRAYVNEPGAYTIKVQL